MRAHPDRIGHHAEVGVQATGECTRERLQRFGPARIVVARGLEVKLQQPGPAVRPLEPPAQRPVQIGQLNAHLLRREAAVGELLDRPRFVRIREQPPQRQQRPPAVHAAVPVEAAEEDRVQHMRRQRILVRPEHMVELVRIFLPHMAERDAGEACRRICIEAETTHRKAAKYRIRMFAASNGSAVGICARITPY